MLSASQKNKILEEMLAKLALPDSAYEKAKARYEDLGKWLSRDESILKDNDPHVFPQGSFRLGTAIRPLKEGEEYDLDLSCKLRRGISTENQTQKQVKELVKLELESYKTARGLKEKVSEKPRCWRLNYQDQLKFHMDIVPCIPALTSRQHVVFDSLTKSGTNEILAQNVSSLTSNITDNRHPFYSTITTDWQISNPEGYAKWFESQLEKNVRKDFIEKAKVEKLPTFSWNSPLQSVIQILKRHRDIMFEGEEDSKPISIIITTLAARAYSGENDLDSALKNIISTIGSLVATSAPRIPNPVNLAEDFSDKWNTADGRKFRLEENFWKWIDQVNRDFDYLFSTDSAEHIVQHTERKFRIHIDKTDLQKSLGSEVKYNPSPTVHIVKDPSPPWSSWNNE